MLMIQDRCFFKTRVSLLYAHNESSDIHCSVLLINVIVNQQAGLPPPLQTSHDVSLSSPDCKFLE